MFLIEPFTRAPDTINAFGADAPTVLAIVYWAGFPLQCVANGMSFVSDVLPPLVNTTWKEKITHYLERVAFELLDVETGKNLVMARLAAEQSQAEAFAISMNSIMSIANGTMNLLYIVWIFAMLAMLGVPSAATGATRVQVGLWHRLLHDHPRCAQFGYLTGPNRIGSEKSGR